VRNSFVATVLACLALIVSAASVNASLGMGPSKLIEERAAFEPLRYFHGNDFGPDFERLFPIAGKAA
jgi:hypothetical protein